MSGDRLEFRLANLDCENDAARLRRGLEGHPGLKDVRIYPKAAKLSVSLDVGQTSTKAFESALGKLGFPVRPTGAAQPRVLRNPKVLTSLASGVLLAAGWLLSRAGVSSAITWPIFLGSLVVGAWYFGREAVEELVRERDIGIELLMLVAAVAAMALGEPMEAAMLAFLYSISEAAEGFTEQKTRSAIRALMDLAPKVATVRRDGKDVEVPVEELVSDDVFLVRPGQSVPTDGVVQTGRSSLNQAPVTGESVPVEKEQGDKVFAGSINGEGALEVKATSSFANNTISRIIHMVEEAQEKKGKNQQFIERFGKRYSPAVLLLGVVVALVGPLLLDGDWRQWLVRATVVVVAAAPCALVISIPVTMVATLGAAARQGVLIKGGVFLEALAGVKVVALDKTGTLTRGEPEVTDVQLNPSAGHKEPQLLEVAAGIERQSQHPLARAIVKHAEAQKLSPAEVSDFASLTGAGTKATFEGTEVFVGSPAFFGKELALELSSFEADVQRFQQDGKTVVLIGDRTSVWGLIAVRDNLRSNARAAVEALRAAGVRKVVMLSGDNRRTAEAVAKEAGIDEVYADLKPEDKVARVRELKDKYGSVAMVGDGVNDAPALAEAGIGIAMGAAGTDVALETADVALMGDDLEKLVYALRLAKRNRAVIQQNLALSALVIGTLVVGALAGVFSLPVAVLAHEVSEFVVIASGLRMLRS